MTSYIMVGRKKMQDTISMSGSKINNLNNLIR